MLVLLDQWAPPLHFPSSAHLRPIRGSAGFLGVFFLDCDDGSSLPSLKVVLRKMSLLKDNYVLASKYRRHGERIRTKITLT